MCGGGGLCGCVGVGCVCVCVWVGAFVFTYERGHTFDIFPTNEDTKKKHRGRPRFFKACKESYTAQTSIWGVGPPLVVICQGPRCGG